MAKESGVGMIVTVDDAAGNAQTFSDDAMTVQVSTPKAMLEVTGLGKYAKERLHGIGDASFSFTGAFNDGTNASHNILKTIPSSLNSRTVNVSHSGNHLVCECLGNDYALNRTADGGLTWTSTLSLSNGANVTWA